VAVQRGLTSYRTVGLALLVNVRGLHKKIQALAQA